MKKNTIAILTALIITVILCTSVYAVDFGSKDTIKQVQEALNAAGYDCGTPDGVAGGKTISAISAYRNANGLPEGTEIDEILYQALIGGSEEQAINKEAIPADDCIEKTMLHYANSLAKVSYAEVKSYLDEIGYNYETTIGSDELATFNVVCDGGKMYLGFYPLSDEDSAYGDPGREMLSALEFSNGEKWITISDTLHINAGELITGDKERDPVNQNVNSLQELIDFYNTKMGGSVTIDPGVTVSTDSDREKIVSQSISSHVSSTYTYTTVENVNVNSNAGTSDPDDFIVLVDLRWDQKNSISTSQSMLEMYGDDLAATLAAEYSDASEITLFWEVPYLLENSVCAKYSYSCSGGKAYRTETTGPLYY